jgi:hypothetical protein
LVKRYIGTDEGIDEERLEKGISVGKEAYED